MSRTPALHAFIENEAGGTVNVVIRQVSVGGSAALVLPANFERMAAAIINTGTANLAAAPTNQVSFTNGILLGASGGGVSLAAKDDLALVGWDWWGVSATGTITVTVMEIIRINAVVQDTARQA